MKSLGMKQALAVTSLPTPSASYQGVTVRLTTDNKAYWCDGSSWIDLTAGGAGGGAVIVSEEGTQLTSAVSSLNFTGPKVKASAAGNAVTVEVIDSDLPLPSFVSSTTVSFAPVKSVCQGEGVVFALYGQSGGYSVGWYSNDGGRTWNPSTSVTGSEILNQVVYGNGRFIAVGGNGTNVVTKYSYDGNTWYNGGTAIVGDYSYTVRFGNGVFVLTTGSGTSVYYSSDGVTWTAAASFGEQVEGLIFTRGKFYCTFISTGTVKSSPNGITWTTVGTSGTFGLFFRIVEKDGVYIGLSMAGTTSTYAKSTDLIDWTTHSFPVTIGTPFDFCVYGGYFVIPDASSNRLLASLDGLAWNTITLAATSIFNACGAVEDGVVFCPANGYNLARSPFRFAQPPKCMDNKGGLTLTNTLNPGLPNPQQAVLFGRSLANRVLPASMGPSGMDACLQPAVWRQKIARWSPLGNSTTAPGVDGFANPTVVGTVTIRNVAATNLLTRMRRVAYVSAATAAAVAGHYSVAAGTQYTTGNGSGLGGFFYSCRFAITDVAAVAGARFFAGLTSSIAAPTNVEPSTLTNSFGVAQLSTDSTQLYFVYGGSAAQAAIPLGTNFPPMAGVGITNGIAYDLTLFCPPNANGVVHYRLERIGTAFVAEGTITPATPGTQTPLNSTLLGHRIWRTNNATLLGVGIDICGLYIETDY